MAESSDHQPPAKKATSSILRSLGISILGCSIASPLVYWRVKQKTGLGISNLARAASYSGSCALVSHLFWYHLLVERRTPDHRPTYLRAGVVGMLTSVTAVPLMAGLVVRRVVQQPSVAGAAKAPFFSLAMTGAGALAGLALVPELPLIGGAAGAINAFVSSIVFRLKPPPRKKIVWEEADGTISS